VVRLEVVAAALTLAQSGAGWEHRRRATVDRVDDLAAVDSLQVDTRDAEVGMPNCRWMTLSGTPSRAI
jgi:hypothetical protein